MSAATSGQGARWAALAVLLSLAFFALQIPDLFDVTRYHGDERFYTDAAIGMVKTGDFLTPRYPSGAFRFEKPILSYLLMVGSYALFGISVFSSRLPFLLAGALLVFATWRAGCLLLRDREAALLAAGLVAACPDFLILSARSTPDIFLCLFLLVGLTGFALLLKAEPPPARAPALAWLGAGLGMAVKGGLGGVLIGYALAFGAVSRAAAARLRRLLHPVWAPVGVLIAAGGFGVYALVHGVAGLERSVHDQVGPHVITLGGFLEQLARYAVIPFEHLAPWVVLVAVGALRDPRALADFARREPVLLRFALGWLLVVLLIFSGADVVRGRYLAPVYPILAVVLAGVLMTLVRRGRATGVLRGLCVTLLAVLSLAGLALAAGGERLGAGLVVAGLATSVAAVLGLVLSRRARAAPIFALAVTALVVQTIGESSVRAEFSRTPVPLLAERLTAPELAGLRVAQIGESAHLASKLRVATGGRVAIEGYQRDRREPDWKAYDVVVTDAPIPPALAALGFRIEPCGESWGEDWTPREILEALRANDPQTVLGRRSQPYYLAIRAPQTSR